MFISLFQKGIHKYCSVLQAGIYFQLTEDEFKNFDIPKWNIKLGRYKKNALRFYRTGCCYAIKRIR